MDALPVQYAKTTDGVNIAYITIGAGPPMVFASNTLAMQTPTATTSSATDA